MWEVLSHRWGVELLCVMSWAIRTKALVRLGDLFLCPQLSSTGKKPCSQLLSYVPERMGTCSGKGGTQAIPPGFRGAFEY